MGRKRSEPRKLGLKRETVRVMAKQLTVEELAAVLGGCTFYPKPSYTCGG
jgi:hypothetical protein